MTRINCIPARELTDKHLGAEYRELPRVFLLVLNAAHRGEHATDSRFPTKYTLGPGHVLFFYPRVAWLVRRYREIVEECRRRGRKVTHGRVPAFVWDIPPDWFGDWHPTPEAQALNRARIEDRLNNR